MMKKILVVDDETQLYRQMFSDLWDMEGVEEIPKICIPQIARPLYRMHFSRRINSIVKLPFKNIWNRFYGLSGYEWKEEDDYWVVILNGAVKTHLSMDYLRNVKTAHSNIKYALVFFDVYRPADYHNGMNFNLFDKILSFDKADCSKYGFTFMPQGQVFSKPKNMQVSKEKKTDIFFAGMGAGRVGILNEIALRLEGQVDYKMHVIGVSADKQEMQTHIAYNRPISYEEEMQYVYNTNTVLDVVKEGQSGITLRICEALLFNKKILTNNESVRYMPFYNPTYIHIYKDASEIDVSFIKDNRSVDYGILEDYFSPKHIIGLLADEKI